jgi:hypothetical protein
MKIFRIAIDVTLYIVIALLATFSIVIIQYVPEVLLKVGLVYEGF